MAKIGFEDQNRNGHISKLIRYRGVSENGIRWEWKNHKHKKNYDLIIKDERLLQVKLIVCPYAPWTYLHIMDGTCAY